MTPPSWKCDFKSKIWLRQSMRIDLQNVPVKFHPDAIWNDGAFGFLKTRSWHGIPARTAGLGLMPSVHVILYCQQCQGRLGPPPIEDYAESIWRFLQRVSIACYAKRCISYRKSVRLSVCPSVCPSVCLPDAGTVSKWLQLRSCCLHWRIAPWL